MFGGPLRENILDIDTIVNARLGEVLKVTAWLALDITFGEVVPGVAETLEEELTLNDPIGRPVSVELAKGPNEIGLGVTVDDIVPLDLDVSEIE